MENNFQKKRFSLLVIVILVATLSVVGVGVHLIYKKYGMKREQLKSSIQKQAKITNGISPEILDISKKIIGAWKSNDDYKYVTIFYENNTSQDLYDGQIVDEGNWFLESGANGCGGHFVGNYICLIVNLKSDKNYSYYYSVDLGNDGNMSLTYLDRGNTLSYTRIK